MKRSELALIKQKLNMDMPRNNEQIFQLLKQRGLIQDNLYQEQEMESDKAELFFESVADSSIDSMLSMLHSHTYYEILLISGGSLEYLLETKRYRIERGSIIFIPPGVAHGPILPDHMEHPYERYAMWCSKSTMDRLRSTYDLSHLLDRNAQVLQCTSAITEDLIYRCRATIHEEEVKDYGWKLVHDCQCAEILVLLERLYAQGQFVRVPRMRNDLLDGILYYLESHLSDRITLDSVADRFHVSVSTVSHLFSRQFNTSFYQYVIQLRLVAAKNMILDGKSMEEVARNTGFTDYTAFYRSFKTAFGISPRQFRTHQLEMTKTEA